MIYTMYIKQSGVIKRNVTHREITKGKDCEMFETAYNFYIDTLFLKVSFNILYINRYPLRHRL